MKLKNILFSLVAIVLSFFAVTAKADGYAVCGKYFLFIL